jgi:hypothetical protein
VNIDHTMHNPLGAIAGNWYPSLLPNAAIATIEGRGLANDRLVQHQNHGSPPLSQPAF